MIKAVAFSCLKTRFKVIDEQMIAYKLAIIIPAYKATFLDAALASIASQSCKDFTLYIGDDASPHDLLSIIERYNDILNIRYTRFPENLGGKDLVAQWQRCFELINDEDWIWLFSDDDVMGPNCVEAFYAKVKANDDYDIYHFNVDVIDADNKHLRNGGTYPPVYFADLFVKNRLKFGECCFVVEFIFRRSKFLEVGGFAKFDLAWGSDVATWAMIGKTKGICAIDTSKVMWRESDENISPDTSKPIQKRKLRAFTDFLLWANRNFGPDKDLKYCMRVGLLNRLKYSPRTMSFLDIFIVLNLYVIKLRHFYNYFYCLFYLLLYYPFKQLKSVSSRM
jgi:glycosyltransferase involved in cell wall biosynthesis